MKKLYWFGDSWVSGVNPKIKPFPNLASEILGLPYENLGVIATSIDDMVLAFRLYLDRLSPNTDVVIFCLTSAYRINLVDKDGKLYRMGWSANINVELGKTWNTYFANDYSTSYLAHKSISLLYYMCQSQGIECYFVNSFSTLKSYKNLFTPTNTWLLPPEECLANELLSIIEPEPLIIDISNLDNQTWLDHKKLLDQYFIPHDTHPNQLGNKKIAELLTDKLKLKLYEPR